MKKKNDDQKSPIESFIESLDDIDDLNSLFDDHIDTMSLDYVNYLIKKYNLEMKEDAFALFVELVDRVRQVKNLKLDETFSDYLQAFMWEVCLNKHTKPLDIAMTGFLWGIIFASIGEMNIENDG